MKRIITPNWHNWQQELQDVGVPNPIYKAERGTTESDWLDGVAYSFTRDEIAQLKEATLTVNKLMLNAVNEAVNRPDIMLKMAIPESSHDLFKESWESMDKNLVGRMDWSFDADGTPKLLEINGDSVQGLVLAGPGQLAYLEAVHKSKGKQWNDIAVALESAFGRMSLPDTLYFTGDLEDQADILEISFIEERARVAGLNTRFISLEDIGITNTGRFADLGDDIIEAILVYQPWEWTLDTPFGDYFLHGNDPKCTMIEPAWRMLVSNKGLMALMWEMYEGHENLLPTFIDYDARADGLEEDYAQKPIYGFEAANVTLVESGQVIAENPDSEADSSDGYVYQGLCPLPEFDGKYAQVCTWMIADQAAGLSVKESDGLISDYFSPTVPHIIS